MSPLAGLILRIMRAGSLAAAGFVVLVIAIEGWKYWQHSDPNRGNTGFLVVLILMLLGFLWLARAITQEIRKPGP